MLRGRFFGGLGLDGFSALDGFGMFWGLVFGLSCSFHEAIFGPDLGRSQQSVFFARSGEWIKAMRCELLLRCMVFLCESVGIIFLKAKLGGTEIAKTIAQKHCI